MTSTMLTTVATLWPPAPGPQQTQTGTKTMHGTGPVLIEKLNDLHEPAWWSGVRVVTAEPMGFRIRLLKGDGSPVFDLAEEACTWVQNSGSWVQFPWAIPAAMGKAIDMKLEVSALKGSGLFTAVTCCFHELPNLKLRDRYLFMNAEGGFLHVWNGFKKEDGAPGRGLQPVWRTIHGVIPPTQMLTDWNNSDFCIHEWSDKVEL